MNFIFLILFQFPTPPTFFPTPLFCIKQFYENREELFLQFEILNLFGFEAIFALIFLLVGLIWSFLVIWPHSNLWNFYIFLFLEAGKILFYSKCLYIFKNLERVDWILFFVQITFYFQQKLFEHYLIILLLLLLLLVIYLIIFINWFFFYFLLLWFYFKSLLEK